MRNWIDFKDIRERVSLEDVILKYSDITTLERRGSRLIGPCPVHGGDAPRAFNADLSKNVWFCFSVCKSGGNQLDFVAKREDISIREAAIKLRDYFLLDDNAEERKETTPRKPTTSSQAERKPREEQQNGSNPALKVSLQLDGTHPHLTEHRKLKPETVSHFGVGYCARGIMRGTIAIPIHDEEGNLVAYAGRRLKPQAIREEGKYKLPKKFRKSQVLFNFHRAVPFAAERGLILVEGFFSVLKLYEAGFQNVVASMGTDVSDAQAALLAQAAQVTVIFDGNDAGYAGADAVQHKLAGRTLVRVVKLPRDLEPEDLSMPEIRWVSQGLDALGFTELSFSQDVDLSLFVSDEEESDTESEGLREYGPPEGSARCASD